MQNISDPNELFGNFDKNIKLVEDELNVKIINRSNNLIIEGERNNTYKAIKVLDKMLNIIKNNESLNEQKISYLITLVKEGIENKADDIDKELVAINSRGKPIKPRTIAQKGYVDSIKTNTITLGIGPAGTGKTFLAVAMAVTAFKRKEIDKIILTRPAVEAGEKLGFLPGDLQDKVDPYLRPLYDALFEMLGGESFQKLLERGNLEVAPLAYMRGRTLDNAFIVLDEAQNTTPEQMKMFLTRIGYGSKAVITGDLTQIDLTEGKRSGLLESTKILSGIEDIGIITLTNKDVVRHPLVQKIIQAYEKFENKKRK